MPVISVQGRQRQEKQEFKASLVYVRASQNKDDFSEESHLRDRLAWSAVKDGEYFTYSFNKLDKYLLCVRPLVDAEPSAGVTNGLWCPLPECVAGAPDSFRTVLQGVTEN